MTSILLRRALAAGCLALLALPCTAGAPELTQYRGHVVWLDFWASWCGPCQQSFPWMQQIQQRYAARGLIVVAVNLDHVRGDAERFLAAHPHDFVVRFDATDELPKQLHVSAMPTSFLLDAQGNVVATHAGFKPTNESQYEAELERLLRSPQS